MENAELKVFILSFNGHYLGADMLVSDTTKLKAFNRAKKEIKKQGLDEKNTKLSIDDLKEVIIEQPFAYTINNGDY